MSVIPINRTNRKRGIGPQTQTMHWWIFMQCTSGNKNRGGKKWFGKVGACKICLNLGRPWHCKFGRQRVSQ